LGIYRFVYVIAGFFPHVKHSVPESNDNHDSLFHTLIHHSKHFQRTVCGQIRAIETIAIGHLYYFVYDMPFHSVSGFSVNLFVRRGVNQKWEIFQANN